MSIYSISRCRSIYMYKCMCSQHSLHERTKIPIPSQVLCMRDFYVNVIHIIMHVDPDFVVFVMLHVYTCAALRQTHPLI